MGAVGGMIGRSGVLCLKNDFSKAQVEIIWAFEYSALIWATLLGYFLWGELPDAITLVGAAIVISSGLYIIYRETIKVGRARPQLPSMSPDDTGQ